jgi:copper homeostasis protein
MANQVLVEICVASVDHAVAAERGGADRIELCSNLACGGVTPNAALMRAARQQVRIPIYGMIRPSSGDFCYSEHEIDTMKCQIDVTKEIGLDGIVLGLLDEAMQVDRDRTRALVRLAHPLPVTFHRAFDLCPDLTAALEAVIETGAQRILTSGGRAHAIDGLANIAHLLTTAGDRIVIMPGGGIRLTNVERIVRGTGAREIHSSLDTSATDASRSEIKVREFRRAVEAF